MSDGASVVRRLDEPPGWRHDPSSISRRAATSAAAAIGAVLGARWRYRPSIVLAFAGLTLSSLGANALLVVGQPLAAAPSCLTRPLSLVIAIAIFGVGIDEAVAAADQEQRRLLPRNRRRSIRRRRGTQNLRSAAPADVLDAKVTLRKC